MENNQFKSGFVTLIGRPNVGKSTLMNHLIGQKIAITSNKPQTTRNRIQTVYTSDEGQIIFLDTPGIHKAKNKLGEYMVTAAEQTLGEVDVVLWLVEPTDYIGKGEQHIAQRLKTIGVPVILILNKMDTVDKHDIPHYLDVYRELCDFEDMIPVCALRGLHMDQVIRAIFRCLPYGPKFYDDDTVTDQPQRQIVAELIREKALRCLDEEIPHGIAVSIETMQERPAGSRKKKEGRAEAARRRNRHVHTHDRARGNAAGPEYTDNHSEDGNSNSNSVQGKPMMGASNPQNGPGKAAAGASNSQNGPGKPTSGNEAAERVHGGPASRRAQSEIMLREDSDWIMDIEATIICEKESHKGMVIGHQGAMLRKIGSQARYEIEQMLEEPVNLQLWVKVKKDWRDSDFMIKNFGYDKKELE
ncbi:MAG: GTPase Era [Lachnospiraceae bacterium]|nr:GTPase Era [Lachnospiraceae bacterium]